MKGNTARFVIFRPATTGWINGKNDVTASEVDIIPI